MHILFLHIRIDYKRLQEDRPVEQWLDYQKSSLLQVNKRCDQNGNSHTKQIKYLR
jgi:hypothetical protein